jgi:hypothetical protein
MVDIRITNAAVMVETESDVDIRVTNAAVNIEYEASQYLRVQNAAIDIEYTATQYLRVQNAAIMIEYINVIVPEPESYHTHVADTVTLSPMTGPTIGTSGLIVYADFVAVAKNYYARPDEPGLDFEGPLTLGCWVWFDAPSTGAATGLMSKWGVNDEQSYMLYKTAGNALTFAITNDGSTPFTIGDAVANYAVGQWFYVVGRFTPNIELALFVNGTWYLDVTDIPPNLYDSTTAFELGRYGGGNYLDGRMCHSFLCGYAVPDRFIEAMYAHSKAMFMSR